MADSLAALVLGAGGGTRLRPLTNLRPKVLCPVGGVPLLGWALDRVAGLGLDVAVNARYHVGQLTAFADGRAHVSDEASYPDELGTAGAVGALRPWLDGRAVVVVNGDTWTDVPLAPLLDGWDGERVRVLVHGPPGTALAPGVRIVASIVPAADVASLPASPLGLSNGLWWPAQAAERLEVVTGDGAFVSCDTPRLYLAANLAASGGATVVGDGAKVEGRADRCVLWPGVRVARGEALVDAIRASAQVTVLVR
jgi:MurNAc alpha-1-phosphate uridylyltransferase